MKAGDHIYIYLKHKSGFKFTHHGIYIGNSKVIHYWKNKVRKTKINRFSCGKNIHVKHYKKSYSSSRVVKRAKKKLDERKYNLFLNNCEHFATWCKIGKHKSEQIDNVPIIVLYKKTQQEISKVVDPINPYKIRRKIKKMHFW
ncbi:MAG: lecithin retinol acyltransferase family protein [Nostocaceae cyanobacterium]|nr:lecithin retinol acyltransferase family protein [Nostocaceae cyanobacterium]